MNKGLFPENITKELIDSGELINVNRDDYPKIVGIDKRNGKTLNEIYYCEDVCPLNANIILVYDEVNSEKECGELGGESLISTFLGERFIGCRPIIKSS